LARPPAVAAAQGEEAMIMSLQMQLHRGVIALVLGLALGGVALGSGSADDALGAHGVGAVIRAVQKDNSACDSSLRIEVAHSVHVTVPCDLSCAPMNSLLNTLHVSTTMRQSRCAATHTA
jgi:predicted Kef-type K+ transport protein